MAYQDGREYMQIRNFKLQSQLSLLEKKSNLFQGISFYFNGYLGTESSLLDMQELVASHGGLVCPYLSAKVDYLVTTSMSASKWNMVARNQRVVLPEFIYDSIRSGKIEDWRRFELVDELKLQGQSRLDVFLSNHIAGSHHDDSMSLPIDWVENGDQEYKEKNENKKRARDELDLSDPHISSLLVTNPDFIPHYFASSRLHHLSIWKNELISKTNTIMKRMGKKGRKSTTFQPRVIMHVDMDCFFVSVALRFLDPGLRTRPVVVSHSHSKSSPTEFSTAEIASCNYIAREKGIKNGSYLGKAILKCPDLVVLDYNYEAIAECTTILYDILVEKSCFVQAVSCDEALIDVTDFVWKPNYTPTQVEEHCLAHAESLRIAIEKGTKGCCASIGIGWNPLQARIATFFAKPNGVFFLLPESIDRTFNELPISKIPGIGSITLDKFHSRGLQTCLHAQEMGLSDLKDLVGEKTGEYVYDACRGIDHSILENKIRTSCSVEINWGVRFRFQEQVKDFMMRLAGYLFKERLDAKNEVEYIHLTVKAKKRNYQGEPSKFLGCGHCIDYSKSILSSIPYTSSNQIFGDAYRLLVEMQIPATELRGIGIHLKPKSNTLENGQRLLSFNREGSGWNSPSKEKINPLLSMKLEKSKNLVVPKENKKQIDQAAYLEFKEQFGMNPSQVDLEILQDLPQDIVQEFEKTGYKAEKRGNQDWSDIDMFPSFSQIDMQVLKELPKEIQHEQRALALAAKQKKKRALKKKQIEEHYSVEKINMDVVVKRRKRPSLAFETDPQIIMDYIIEWVQSSRYQACENEDINYMVLYLKELVDDMQLERCISIVKYLHHQIKLVVKEGECFCDNWRAKIEAMSDKLNQYVFTLYGSVLDESYQ